MSITAPRGPAPAPTSVPSATHIEPPALVVALVLVPAVMLLVAAVMVLELVPAH